MSLLIVASPTSSPLCTDVAIPTDGQPQWVRCPECEVRFEPTLVDRDPASRVRHQACGRSPVPDGPFPLWAGRWAEVESRDSLCPGTCVPDCVRLCGPGGAIVELVEVVGPSHFPYLGMHHSRCSDEHLCHPDAAPACFHTPTGQVTVLDRPIPCERPPSSKNEEALARTHYWALHGGMEARGVLTAPASVWTADDALTAKLTEVAR